MIDIKDLIYKLYVTDWLNKNTTAEDRIRIFTDYYLAPAKTHVDENNNFVTLQNYILTNGYGDKHLTYKDKSAFLSDIYSNPEAIEAIFDTYRFNPYTGEPTRLTGSIEVILDEYYEDIGLEREDLEREI